MHNGRKTSDVSLFLPAASSQGSRVDEEGASPPSAPAQQNNPTEYQHQHLPQTLPENMENFIVAAL